MNNDEFELPLVEFCTLDRATRIIGGGCEVEDLLHWGEIGAIRLSTKIPFGSFSEANIVFYGESRNEIIRKIKAMDYTNVNSYVLPGACSFNLEGDLLSHIDESRSSDESIVLTRCSINGVWDIEYIFDVELNGVVGRDFTTSIPFVGLDIYKGFDCYIEYDEYFVSKKDLLVTRKFIEKIMGRKGKVIGVQPHVDNKTVRQRKSSNSLTDNKKNKLIKALIEIAYGKGSSEKPRSLLNEERGTGEMLIDFHKMGIEPPVTGSTLADYLKDVELDYVQIPTASVENDKK
ncbi:hypothetical protein [Serratia fonticola]